MYVRYNKMYYMYGTRHLGLSRAFGEQKSRKQRTTELRIECKDELKAYRPYHVSYCKAHEGTKIDFDQMNMLQHC